MNEVSNRIVSLEIENIKKIVTAFIEPDGSTVIIGGENAQGKTTVLDAIEMALSGKKSVPEKPIRNGEKTGRVVVELEDYIVKRVFTEYGSNLTVTHKDGSKITNAQTLLNNVIGPLSMDPLRFTRLDQKDQARTLRELVGLDTTKIDEKREDIFSERTDVNRDLKTLTARLSAAEKPAEDLPEQPVSVAELMDELNEAQKITQNVKDQANRRKEAVVRRDKIHQEMQNLKERLIELNGDLNDNQQRIDDLDERIKILNRQESDIGDVWEIQDRITEAGTTNEQIQKAEQYRELEQMVSKTQKLAEGLTRSIEELDTEKSEMLENAVFPVPDLSINKDGIVTYQGVPFDQGSAAEKLLVSASIALALNPRLPILLIRDASLLDDSSMKILTDFAIKNNAQVWMERVGDHDLNAVIIEDGSIKQGGKS